MLLIYSGTTWAQDRFVMRMALSHNPHSSWVKACLRFEEEVERASDGRLSVEVFHRGQLGSTRQVLELVYLNAIDVSPVHIDWVELYEALKMGVVDAQENPPFFVYLGRIYEVQRVSM